MNPLEQAIWIAFGVIAFFDLVLFTERLVMGSAQAAQRDGEVPPETDDRPLWTSVASTGEMCRAVNELILEPREAPAAPARPQGAGGNKELPAGASCAASPPAAAPGVLSDLGCPEPDHRVRRPPAVPMVRPPAPAGAGVLSHRPRPSNLNSDSVATPVTVMEDVR